MCFGPNDQRIAAIKYFSEAKRKNKHLKKLKSVSRAYRKSAVRGLKIKAIECEARADELLQAEIANQKQREILRQAHERSISAVNSLMPRNKWF